MQKIFTNHEVRPELKEPVLNPVLRSRHKTIFKYLDDQKIAYDPQEIAGLQRLIKKKLFHQVSYLALLVFRIMQATGDWGSSGEEQAKATFGRSLLKIAPEDDLTWQNLTELEAVITQRLAQNEMTHLAQDAALQIMKTYEFDLLGQRFLANDVTEINAILHFLQINWVLEVARREKIMQYLLAEGRKKHINGYDLFFCDREIVRSPNTIMTMAAMIVNRNIYLRMESFRLIFQKKWLNVFNSSSQNYFFYDQNIYRQISEGIKRKAIELSSAPDQETFLQQKNIFLKDMQETILFHELGHGVIFHDCLDMETSAIADASDRCGESLLAVIMEVLADLAPRWQKLRGPLQNMVDIAQKDSVRAERMFYIYLSDVWFFDTPDDYMFLYSEVICLIMQQYIQPDLHIDFAKIAVDLQYGQEHQSALLGFMIGLAKTGSEKVKKIITEAKYHFPSGAQDFNYAKKIAHNILNENGVKTDETSYRYHDQLWSTLISFVLNFALKGSISSRTRFILPSCMFSYSGKQEETYEAH